MAIITALPASSRSRLLLFVCRSLLCDDVYRGTYTLYVLWFLVLPAHGEAALGIFIQHAGQY